MGRWVGRCRGRKMGRWMGRCIVGVKLRLRLSMCECMCVGG